MSGNVFDQIFVGEISDRGFLRRGDVITPVLQVISAFQGAHHAGVQTDQAALQILVFQRGTNIFKMKDL